MIGYIRGILEEADEQSVIIDNHGIGYRIFVPSSAFSGALPIGKEVKIYTYLSVKEDAMQLFGFLDRDDLSMFEKLIKVNGIGPKGALGILSVMTPDDLRFAILSEDVKAISGAPGIGAKTAGKVILELKDKVDLEDAFEKKLQNVNNKADVCKAGDEVSSMINEAVAALVALGYSKSEATRGVRSVEITEDMDVSKLLKEGLKRI